MGARATATHSLGLCGVCAGSVVSNARPLEEEACAALHNVWGSTDSTRTAPRGLLVTCILDARTRADELTVAIASHLKMDEDAKGAPASTSADEIPADALISVLSCLDA